MTCSNSADNLKIIDQISTVEEHPTNHQLSPIEEEEHPTNHQLSPIEEEEHPTNHRLSPIEEEEHPTNHRLSPIQEEEHPTNHQLSPIEEEEHPTNHQLSPISALDDPYLNSTQNDASTVKHIQFEHDPHACRELNIRATLTLILIILGYTACLIAAIAGFYKYLQTNEEMPIFLAIIFIVGIGCTINYIKNNTRNFFKKVFIIRDLNASVSVNSITCEKQSIDWTDHETPLPQSLNLITETISQYFLEILNIGDAWSHAIIDDDISASCNRIPFRFLDLRLSTGSFNTNPVFNGQVFIFNSYLKIQHNVQYVFVKGTACQTPADFENAFYHVEFSKENDYFGNAENRSTQAKHYLASHDRENPQMAETFERIETKSFVNAMIQLAQLMPNHEWGVRFVDQYMILIIPRDKNLFELNIARIKQTMSTLSQDLDEFIHIAEIMTDIDYIA